MTDKEISIRTDGLDDTSKARLQEALRAAGMTLKEAKGPKVNVADVGTIETKIELQTGGMDDAKIQDLRNVGFSAARHSAALDTVLRGSLPGYDTGAAQDYWVQWLWCEWLKYQAKEAFTKRYDVRPWTDKPGAAAAPSGGGW
jgi:hypothetical protein